MEPTKLLYLEDANLVMSEALVLDVRTEEGKTVIVLDRTIFYPQGGGQPYDTGSIVGAAGTLRVDEVRFVDGLVLHKGTMQTGTISSGETVTGTIDADRRQLHRRLHSAGHIVDMAVEKLGLTWVPGKGYHFPDGPYVEYTGSLEGVDKEKLKAGLEKAANDYIAQDRPTTLRFMEKEKMHEVCRHVPDHLPAGKPSRVVLYGDFGVPCGGTHVSRLGEVGRMTIEKLKAKGPVVRVSYRIS